MRFQRLPRLAVFAFALTALPAHAQPKQSLIIFKDGHSIQGKVKRPTTLIVDPASGQSIIMPVPGGFYSVDDDVRNIAFSPNQILEIIHNDPILERKWVRLDHYIGIGSQAMPKSWSIDYVGPFEDSLMRAVKLSGPGGVSMRLDQRLVFLTPRHFRVDGVGREWMAFHFTRELGAEAARALVYKHIALKKQPTKDLDKQLLVYRFLLQGGWTSEAERELDKMMAKFKSARERLEPIHDALMRLVTIQFVDAMELAHKVGQHEEVQERLATFARQKMAEHASPETLLRLQEFKNKYQAANEKLADIRGFFKTLPAGLPRQRGEFFARALQAIAQELNHDTLPRLETFLSQARDWERARKQDRRPSQTPDELLAFAVSGWVLGDGVSQKDPDAAKRLWEAREMVLACQQKDEGVLSRRQRVQSFASNGKGLGADVIARMIPLLPPPEPHDKLGVTPLKLKVEMPGVGQGTTYEVQLPPEYHPQRAYPVLFILHHSGETPAQSLGRWTELAARHGYILVAPLWGKGKPTYQYTEPEHGRVLGTLHDLRRRFQIDSDRVFLFGCQEGGRMAFDVGLSHPDLFAGVLPMAAVPRFHSFRYWPNAQFLPFYVVNGDHTGVMVKDTRTLFKDWIRLNYPAFNVEYKGRAAEWFEAEPELMIDWMNRKKRVHPMKMLGGPGEEFKTMRAADNRFYWLSTDAVLPRFLNDAARWNQNTIPATLQARIFTDNQINVRTHGVGQVTIWLGPGMVDYAQPVKVFINSNALAPRKIVPSVEELVEDFCQRGDRQRLYWARIAIQLKV